MALFGKRYLVFAGDTYEPKGGWLDVHINTENRDEAIGYAKGFVAAESLRWAHVVDTTNGEVIHDTTGKTT